MITTLLAFLFTLGVLIVIHEYGHYRVARFFDAAGLLKREPRNNPEKAKPGQKATERAEERAKRAADAEAAKNAPAEAPAEEAASE